MFIGRPSREGHASFDGCLVGQHALVCRLLRGARLSCFPAPHYSATWDVSCVLRFSFWWLSDEGLSLQQLSAKLVTLFCFIACKWVSDTQALDWEERSFMPDGVS